MDFVSNVQDAEGEISRLPKTARKNAYREFFNASLAVAPFDQDSQNAESAATAIVADPTLRSVLADAIVAFQSAHAKDLKHKDLTQWCKGEVFRAQETAYECEKLKKKDCEEPKISYTECAHLPEVGRSKK